MPLEVLLLINKIALYIAKINNLVEYKQEELSRII